jgi:hypothetical protein
MEGSMTEIHEHSHAAMDRFPQLVLDLTDEFGSEGISTVVERFIEAERADFYWDGRIAETPLGAHGKDLDDRQEAREQVAILGYFRGRYYTAACIVDRARRVRWMLRVRHFDGYETAGSVFEAMG